MSAAGFSAWAAGDVFVAATELNNADDDHAGRGRLLVSAHFGVRGEAGQNVGAEAS